MTAATHKAPISSHPAFKWGVGAWFALLLGLGLFVMPAAVHQIIGARLGLDGTLSGTGLRAALSGMAALLGLLVGLALAMRVASLNAVVADEDETVDQEDLGDVWLHDEDDGADEPVGAIEDLPRRPFNPREDMEEEGIGAPSADPQTDEEFESGLTGSAFEDEQDGDSALMELWREEMGEDADEFPVAPAVEVEPETVPAPKDLELAEVPEDAIEEPEIDEWDEGDTSPAIEEPDEDEWFDVAAPADPVDEPEYDPFSAFGSAEAEDPEQPVEDPVFEPEPAFAETEAEVEVDLLPETPEPEVQQAAPSIAPVALGDLSLDALTERLGTALEAFKAGPAAEEEADPVIAFLRREAEREAPEQHPAPGGDDPQAELRSALDKLSRVGKQK